MPKAPILYRERFYTKRPDGTFVEYDWNLVDTSLGAMIEPALVSDIGTPTVQIDLDDISANRFTLVDENVFPATYGTAGNQMPADYNTR